MKNIKIFITLGKILIQKTNQKSKSVYKLIQFFVNKLNQFISV